MAGFLGPLLFAISCFHLVSAHGSLKAIEVGGTQFLAWQIHKDEYANPLPTRYARRVASEGPVKDFTGKGITYVLPFMLKAGGDSLDTNSTRCGDAGNVAANGTIPIKAGSNV
jgi:hypothetical protein